MKSSIYKPIILILSVLAAQVLEYRLMENMSVGMQRTMQVS